MNRTPKHRLWYYRSFWGFTFGPLAVSYTPAGLAFSIFGWGRGRVYLPYAD